MIHSLGVVRQEQVTQALKKFSRHSRGVWGWIPEWDPSKLSFLGNHFTEFKVKCPVQIEEQAGTSRGYMPFYLGKLQRIKSKHGSEPCLRLILSGSSNLMAKSKTGIRGEPFGLVFILARKFSHFIKKGVVLSLAGKMAATNSARTSRGNSARPKKGELLRCFRMRALKLWVWPECKTHLLTHWRKNRITLDFLKCLMFTQCTNKRTHKYSMISPIFYAQYSIWS